MNKSNEDKERLTKFVNSTYMVDNTKIQKLIELLYRKLTPTLKKYDAILVLKGSTAMRMLHNNLKELLPDEVKIKLEELFGSFVGQSDLDFEVLSKSTKSEKIRSLSKEVFSKFKLIQDELLANPSTYFTNWQMSPKNTTHKARRSEIKFDGEVTYQSKDKTQIYRTLDQNIKLKEFRSHFDLARLKIGFSSPGKYGELIDITFKYVDDSTYLRNIEAVRQKYITSEDDPFEYNVVNTDYMLKDLNKILFKDTDYPWQIEKRDKRVARYIYLNWLNDIHKKGITSLTLNSLRLRLERELNQLLEGSAKTKLNNDKYDGKRGNKSHEARVTKLLRGLRDVTITFNKYLAKNFTSRLNIT